MKVIVLSIVCFCMKIKVQGDHLQTKRLLDRKAAEGRIIGKIFQPSENGYLGEGMAGLVYKGVLLFGTKIEVAMKFIPKENKIYAENELRAYTSLGAVNNTETEAKGIPTLYHYGQWRNYFMFGITLLDSKFANRIKNNQLTTVDRLIVFGEMVRISKYMHIRGICQGDLHLKNIMFRKHQGFIIDYNLAIDAKKNLNVVNMCAKRDWRRFLAEFASTVGVKIDWTFQINPINKFQDIVPDGLRRVFREFAMAIYGNELLKYNEIYKIVSDEIERYNGAGPAIVSWLTPEHSLQAFFDLSKMECDPLNL